ncbi:NFU1 iron-sulfur cluster protein [Carex rostrata]
MSVLSKALKFSSSIRNIYGTRGLATSIHLDELQHPIPKKKFRGDYVPVYVALGLILFGTTLGLYTARLQLAYSPNVFVNKKKREAVPEVAIPDWSLQEAEKFFDKSMFRKVAYLQDIDAIRSGIPDPTRDLTKALVKRAETLKDVGVEPPGIETRGGRLRELLGNLVNKKQ